MRIERYKNFLSTEDCAALNAWADKAVQNKWMDAGISSEGSGYKKRFTSRLYADRFEYPQIVRDISNHIRSFCGVTSYPLIEGHGGDGVVVSCTFSGGNVYAHQDPRSLGGLSTLRCNVMTRAADAGAELYIGGQLVSIEVGELHCYLVSEFEHYVTEVQGETSRVLWMFGAAVPAKDWELGQIKVGELSGK
jgi:hypothetical protein